MVRAPPYVNYKPMSHSLKLCIFTAAALTLAGCDDDGARDASPNEQMTRESLCVAASERFTLYKQAERHKSHGLEAARVRFQSTGQPSDFLARINGARIEMATKSKDFNATFLGTICDTSVTIGDVESH